MYPWLLKAASLSAAAYLVNILWSLWKNLKLAKSSGIPYVVVPFYSYNFRVTLLARYPLRLLDKISPDPPLTSWRVLVISTWPWKFRHEPFVRLRTDTFLTVAPGGLILHTADANVIDQITERGSDFPKATHLYRNVSIYGTNVVASEGEVWRRHRKAMRLAFTEKNNKLVWDEAVEQGKALLKAWTENSSDSATITTAGQDTMKLSLSVISRAALGWKMRPFGVNSEEHAEGQALDQSGQKMGFTDALTFILRNVILIIAIPKAILKWFPSRKFHKCFVAYNSFGHYMRTLISQRQGPSDSKTSTTDSDILTLLTQTPTLSPTDLLGNLFVLLLAGHETTAHSLHACLFLLALHPKTQQEAQEELDGILTKFDGKWSPDIMNALQSSVLAAVLYEQLRLLPSTINIPKITHTAQRLTVTIPEDNRDMEKDLIIPAGTMIRLCVPAVHRNPRFWPYETRDEDARSAFPPGNMGNDLEEFRVERWLNSSYGNDSTKDGTRKDRGNEDAEEIGNGLFRPPRGAYIPFSAGARACPGRRFATVEVLAVLAVILRRHSVELAGPEDENDQLKGMNKEQRRHLWVEWKEQGTRTWQKGMKMGITLGMKGKSVSMRVVKRGEERFADVHEDVGSE